MVININPKPMEITIHHEMSKSNFNWTLVNIKLAINAIPIPVPAESTPRKVYSVALILMICALDAPIVLSKILSLSRWYLLNVKELINTINPVNKLNIAINWMIKETFLRMSFTDCRIVVRSMTETLGKDFTTALR